MRKEKGRRLAPFFRPAAGQVSGTSRRVAGARIRGRRGSQRGVDLGLLGLERLDRGGGLVADGRDGVDLRLGDRRLVGERLLDGAESAFADTASDASDLAVVVRQLTAASQLCVRDYSAVQVKP